MWSRTRSSFARRTDARCNCTSRSPKYWTRLDTYTWQSSIVPSLSRPLHVSRRTRNWSSWISSGNCRISNHLWPQHISTATSNTDHSSALSKLAWRKPSRNWKGLTNSANRSATIWSRWKVISASPEIFYRACSSGSLPFSMRAASPWNSRTSMNWW